MKVKKDAKLALLIRTARACKEDVFFKTCEGDVLNLKSLLSTLLLQNVISGDPSVIAQGNIVCMNEQDYAVLSEFLEK